MTFRMNENRLQFINEEKPPEKKNRNEKLKPFLQTMWGILCRRLREIQTKD